MVNGSVNHRNEAVVRLRFIASGGSNIELDAVIDTGFSGSISLPASMVRDLALPRCGTSSAFLADGSKSVFEIFTAKVHWDGSLRDVIVYELGEEPLVGMQFLSGHALRIQIVPGGAVEIERFR